jgi:hypothetical protein
MTSTDLKLGKRLGVVHDPRTLRASRVIDVSAVQPPRAHRIARPLRDVPVFANDRYGDCTCASQGHRIVTQERSSGQAREVTLSDADVLEVYSAVTGFDPERPETDRGAYELDVLNYMRKVGMGRERDGTAHTIGAFAAVDWHNHDEVRAAHYVGGGLKVCAALPTSAARELDAGADWSATSDAPGSWGGHSMYSHAYDRERGLAVWTWGREQWMSWAWVDRFVDECYVLISEDYLRRRSQHTPQGFDVAELERYLTSL